MLAPIEHLTYKELVGYDEAVRSVRSLGLGMQKDPEFQQLVRQLNAVSYTHLDVYKRQAYMQGP